MIYERELTEKIIASAIEVHRTLGPGLLESAYEVCLCRELSIRGLKFEKQKPLPISYKGILVECSYRMDMVVEKKVVVEIKTVDCLLDIHEAQLLTYLKLSNIHVGLLLNFHVRFLKDGLVRLVF